MSFDTSSDPNGLILDFTTDVMGNIRDASDSMNPAVKTRKYAYDALYRLSRVDDGNDVLQEDYAYNPTGDRTLKQLGVQAPQVYTYVANTHRLGSVDGVPRSYDDNGNTLTRGDGISFSYSDRNRLSAVSYPAGAHSPGIKAGGGPQQQTYYRYNGRGERVSMSYSLLLQSTDFVYDEAGHHLGRYNGLSGKGNFGDEVIYLDDMPIAVTMNGVLSYLETDHLGTPRIAADPATNAQQWKWDFFGDAFGGNEPVIAASDGIDVRLRYPGQVADGFGVNYNYFRDYEAGTGRYLESDPIGLAAGISTFSYALGAPFNFTDPLGLASDSQCCARARAKVVAESGRNRGYVACCGGKRISCTIDDPFDNSVAASIKRICRKNHEDVHNADTARCLCQGDGEPTGARPGADRNGAECAAYQVSLPCFVNKVRECGRDNACRNSLMKEISWQRGEYATYCGSAPTI